MHVNTTSVVVVLPVVGQPRFSKRINMLQNEKFAVHAVAFEREYHKGRIPDCPIEYIGKVEHGKYLARIPMMLKAVPLLRKAIKNNDVCYCFGIDMGILSGIAGLGCGKPVFLEIGDVRELQTSKKLIGKLFRTIERSFVNKCSLLIVTASDFYDVYYRQWLGVNIDSLLIENKVDRNYLDLSTSSTLQCDTLEKESESIITIGYFGLLRCEWSWAVLKQLIIQYPKCYKLVVAGYVLGGLDVMEFANAHSNVSYLGEYKSPDDLDKLYGCVDISWACYQPIAESDWNLRWARTNRYYESCLYTTPIVCRQESNDASAVEQHGIGYVMAESDIRLAVDALKTISMQQIELWKSNIEKLPRSVYMHDSEAQELANKIQEFVHN